MIALLEHIFAWFVLGNAAFILGFAVVILVYYSRYTQRQHMVHIILMASSFVLLVFLSAGASNFRIFYEGWSRDISNFALFVAMILADIGLLTLWRHRSGKPDGLMHVTQGG